LVSLFHAIETGKKSQFDPATADGRSTAISAIPDRTNTMPTAWTHENASPNKKYDISAALTSPR
jgi:hypothetical protein